MKQFRLHARTGGDGFGRTSDGTPHWVLCGAWRAAYVGVVPLAWQQFGARVAPTEGTASAGSPMTALPNLGWPEFSAGATAPVKQRAAIDHAREFQTRRDLAQYYEDNRRSPDVIARYTALAAALECGADRLRSRDAGRDDRQQAVSLARSDALGARVVRQLQATGAADGGGRRQLITAVVVSGDGYRFNSGAIPKTCHDCRAFVQMVCF